jgi:hypothetical protein
MKTLHRKPFRFEEVWSSNPGCEDVVAESWRVCKNKVLPMYNVMWTRSVHAEGVFEHGAEIILAILDSRLSEVESCYCNKQKLASMRGIKPWSI